MLGSVERMMAILTEHYGGKWPLWLSPRQVMIVPISDKVTEYAQEVRPSFRRLGQPAVKTRQSVVINALLWPDVLCDVRAHNVPGDARGAKPHKWFSSSWALKGAVFAMAACAGAPPAAWCEAAC